MVKMQPDMYAGADSENVKGFKAERGNAQQGTGVKAVKGEGPRYVPPGDKTMESDEHLFRGLTRGSEAPMPFQNPSGIGTGGGRDVMTIISEGKGPMEADYSVKPVGRSLGDTRGGIKDAS